ncbi:hypothetical protein GLOTRDRAFT_136192 [Gloeophyllum trabeum ATCC 11539]|uniref:Nuclear GTPase SLIP-GC n=1 Tax=Gloeophyllum trabeum (strain ATCC 11539 / FP-39264 / Madison 617) TaxID=670483 RepID=S7QHK5_GLOTA|nr:uncharacterized protein GLOTRDRAFT_136192 [Gloeophyllum trabeum ATCC 11539]EPQ59276.1 hypothetical protein GLOTRDRAFT_136192 [Gloeophyllum trabeum ATCC 11539]
MDYKENVASGSLPQASTFIKPEPSEHKISPLSPSNSHDSIKDASTKVKPEPSDAARVFLERGLPVPSYIAADLKDASSAETRVKNENGHAAPIAQNEGNVPAPLPAPSTYKVFETADEIPYTPEDALSEGTKMVKAMEAEIKKINLGSKLRKDVWLREIESLKSQGSPTTMIAICGATGAGKSSILNAILDDNIVPTSGMRACTAVVTEIGYHAKKTIDADVSFLSEAEWKEELAVLLEDLVDEDGNLKRTTDLKSDSGVAWHKVHAVYPSISQEQLVQMSVDQIIARDPKIARILGTTKNIVAKDSKAFAQEISRYIDSKDQKRGDKKKNKDKPKEKEKDKVPSFMDMLKDARGTKEKAKEKDPADEAAFWPLIRQVRVRCNAAALSTGAVLVDLPGVADANAARNNIAKDYMKKCDCVWILAPITRAVDDKTARDLLGDAFKTQLMNGNYDANSITFVATKCDDISCSEVIRALNLDDEPELVEIEGRIEQCNDDMEEWKEKKSEADQVVKGVEKQLQEIRAYREEYKEHMAALENNKPFTPRLTGKAAQKAQKAGKKRKNARGGKGGSPKRRKSEAYDDDDFDDDFDDSDVDMDGNSSEADKSTDEESDGDTDAENGSESGSDSEEQEEVTIESLQTKIKEADDAIKVGRQQLSEARKERKEANDMLATLKKKQAEAQKEKNAFCSLKRSEFSRDVLKEDFRTGLKDLDDAEAERRDPDSFDPSVNIRNYDEIDLPVFTVSSRDYVRLTNQVKGDGDPSCFSNMEHTGVPALQQWCHTLTVSSRERAARNFLMHLKTFANSVRTYMEGIGEVTEIDRATLREKWESTPQDDGAGDFANAGFDLADLGELGALYSMNGKPAKKVDAYGEPTGVTPRLIKDFAGIINKTIEDVQARFKDGLEEKCQAGAEMAASSALTTSDTFASSVHWATYRATLRRHGSFRQDLNVELINPMTRNIASSWSKVFEADLFAAFEANTKAAIKRLVEEVEESAAPALKDRVRNQAELSLEEASVTLNKTLETVREAMNNQQKEVSRCLAPHVQNQLIEGYDRAMLERGKGSVARQKTVFHDFIDDVKDEVFTGGADVIMNRLAQAAEAVGEALEEGLAALAEKVEVSLAVLWEGQRDDPAAIRARLELVRKMSDITAQVQLWLDAERIHRLSSAT